MYATFVQAAHRTALAKGEVGIVERKAAPVLKDFAQRFMDAIQVRDQTDFCTNRSESLHRSLGL